MVDIVRSTELIANFSAEETDAFFTTLLTHYNEHIENAEAEVVKNLGDGFLFYIKQDGKVTEKVFASAIACSRTIISSLPELNQKLKERSLPPVEVRVSMSFGPVSIMQGVNGQILDLFGSTVSTCVKMNKLAKPNGIIVGNALASQLQNLAPLTPSGVFTLNEHVSFPLFEIS